MSENVEKKLKGMVEYLSLLSDMLSRMKFILDNFDVEPSKMNEDGTMEIILANTDPTIVGMLVSTMIKFKGLLDKPMENIDTLDLKTLEEFKLSIADLRSKVFTGEISE